MNEPANIAAPSALQHTAAEYRAALQNPETPQPVKRALKQHFHGAPGGRREQRSQYMASHNIVQCNRYISGKAERPEGVSGRQWKRMRKGVRRIKKALEGRAV